MKRTILTVLATLAVVGVVMLAVGPRAQRVGTTTAVAAPAPAAVPMPAHPCPNIHAAIDGLRSCQQELRDAAHDFCGHKRAAMQAVHEAIEQLRLAEDCEKCR
jgi:hypothetical protein